MSVLRSSTNKPRIDEFFTREEDWVYELEFEIEKTSLILDSSMKSRDDESEDNINEVFRSYQYPFMLTI